MAVLTTKVHRKAPQAAAIACTVDPGSYDATVEGVLASHADTIADFESRISTLEAEAADYESRISALEAAVAALQANDATQDSHIASLNGVVGAY